MLYGLVYFYPYTNIGEPQIPTYFKLTFDFLLITMFIIYGFKNKLDEPRVYFLYFLISVVIIGITHIYHTSIDDYIHYTIRNVVLFSLTFFVNIFEKVSLNKFHGFHFKVFKFVLFFGVLLFILKQLGINNPYGFHSWFWEKNRLISTWLNPNTLGFYLLFYLILEYYKEQKLSFIFLITAASIAITGSLTAMIGLALVFAYVLINILSKKKIKFVFIVSLLAALPIGFYFAIRSGVFDYFLFKIDILFFQNTVVHTSVSARVKNIYDLYNYIRFDNLPSIFFGNYYVDEYVRLDSQYLNLFYNYGLIGLFLYGISQISILIKLYNGKTYYSKAMFFFCIWLFLIAFNLTAYLYRSNVTIFFWIMLMYIFSLEKKELRNKENVSASIVIKEK